MPYLDVEGVVSEILCKTDKTLSFVVKNGSGEIKCSITDMTRIPLNKIREGMQIRASGDLKIVASKTSTGKTIKENRFYIHHISI